MAGGPGEASAEDSLDALLAVRSGTYLIQQTRLSREELDEVEQTTSEMVEKVGRIRVAQVTRMMEADLQRIGFYAALDATASSQL